MQLGSLRLQLAARKLVLGAALLQTSLPAHAGEFEAFTWAWQQPAPTEHVSALIQVDSWSDLDAVAAALRSLPEGKRFIVFQWVSEDLADHPADRVLERTWELRERRIPAADGASGPSAAAASKSASGASVPRKSEGRSARGAFAAKTSGPSGSTAQPEPKLVTISERVPVDRPTQFRGPWMENGIAAVRSRVQAIMRRLVTLRAQVDGIVLSNETTLHAACFLGRDGSLAAIQNDPRWPALARSMGLPLTITDMSWGDDKYFLWTERMAGRFDAAMNQAVFAPIRAAYPNAVVSNYSTGRLLGRFATPDVNGHLDRRATSGFGTHDNFEFYGWLGHWRIEKARGGTAADEVDHAWLAFRVEMHKIRGMNASSSRPKHAWIGQRSWEGMWWGPVAFHSDPLWDELVLQLGMHGVCQFFELSIEDFGTTREANLSRRAADRAALNSVLTELNARVSGSTAGVLTAAQPSWDDQVIATGRRVDDRFVWRFSFAPGIDGVTVLLNDGSEVRVVAEEGRRGAWFEHPANVQLQLDPTRRMPALRTISSEAGK